LDYSNIEKNQQLAAVFRQQRNEKKMTVDEVATKTGIPALHLNSIENGNFEQFDLFYLKMYLKKYATFLGMDFNQFYREIYGASDPQPEPATETASKANVRPAARVKKPVATQKLGKIAGILLGAVVVVFGLYFGWDMIRTGLDQEQPEVVNPGSDLVLSENGEDDEPQEAGMGDQDQEEPEEPEEPAAPETTVTVEESNGQQQVLNIVTTADSAVLTLNFTGNTWLGTNNQTTIPFEGAEMTGAGFVRNDGDTETVTVTESTSFYLNVPNLDRVTFTINGEELPIETTPRHQHITLNITIE